MQSRGDLHKECDIVIVGGGIAALGVARALSSTPHQIVLLEKNKSLGSATSANSLRIMHGGFRYLQSLNIARSLRSIREQIRLKQEFPACMQQLPCLLPLKKGTLRSPWPLSLASGFYSACYSLLEGKPVIKGRVHTQNAGKQFESLPGYAPDGLFCWDDLLLCDPAGLIVELKTALETDGVAIGEGIEFLSAETSDSGWLIRVQDGDVEGTLFAKVIVNASGPWIGEICNRMKQTIPFQPLCWTRAVNLVVKREIEPNYGVAFEGNAGALFFMTPRDGHTVIGTFYSPYEGSQEVFPPDADEMRRMIAQINRSLPPLKITADEIVAVECGLLPAQKIIQNIPQLYGSEQVATVGQSVHVLSTKYTTFLSQGERVAKRVCALL